MSSVRPRSHRATVAAERRATGPTWRRGNVSQAPTQDAVPIILHIVEKTLGSFSNAVTIGEASYLWERGVLSNHLCSDGIPFRAHPFWQRVLARAFPEGWAAADQEALRRRVERSRDLPFVFLGSRRAAVERYVRTWERLYRAIAAETGKRILVDASKSPTRAYLLARGGLDIRVLHVVRDLSGIVRSWRQPKFDPGSASALPTKHPLTVTTYWILHNLLAMMLPYRTSYFRITFEGFLQDPRTCIGRVWRQLDISDPGESPFVGPRAVLLPPDFAFAGNPDRFRRGIVRIEPRT